MMITCRVSTLSSSILLLKHKLLFSSFKCSSSLPSQLVESGYMLFFSHSRWDLSAMRKEEHVIMQSSKNSIYVIVWMQFMGWKKRDKIYQVCLVSQVDWWKENFEVFFPWVLQKSFFPWKKLEAKTPVNKMMKKTMNIYISFSSLTSSLLTFSFYVIPMTYLVMTLKTGMVK